MPQRSFFVSPEDASSYESSSSSNQFPSTDGANDQGSNLDEGQDTDSSSSEESRQASEENGSRLAPIARDELKERTLAYTKLGDFAGTLYNDLRELLTEGFDDEVPSVSKLIQSLRTALEGGKQNGDDSARLRRVRACVTKLREKYPMMNLGLAFFSLQQYLARNQACHEDFRDLWCHEDFGGVAKVCTDAKNSLEEVLTDGMRPDKGKWEQLIEYNKARLVVQVNGQWCEAEAGLPDMEDVPEEEDLAGPSGTEAVRKTEDEDPFERFSDDSESAGESTEKKLNDLRKAFRKLKKSLQVVLRGKKSPRRQAALKGIVDLRALMKQVSEELAP